MARAVKEPRFWDRLFIAAIVLAMTATIAWHFRPLNAAEKKLRGSWSIDTNPQWGRGITDNAWIR